MNYKKDFHKFQQSYITQYPGALKMRQYLPSLKGKSILDVGCGSGIDIEFFKEQGAATIAGVDISKELTDIAKESNPKADIRNEDFSYLSWKENTFDIVWSKYAISCATDITTPLKEIARVCKDSGTVLLQVTHPIRTLPLISSHDYFDEIEIEYPTTDGKILREPHHTLASWINAIIEAGFQIELCEEVINRPKNEYVGTITPSVIIFILKK